MSVWNHVFYFAAPSGLFNPFAGVECLRNHSVIFDAEVYPLFEFDGGHYEADVSNPISGDEFGNKIQDMLRQDISCAFEFRILECPIFFMCVLHGRTRYITWGWQCSFDAIIKTNDETGLKFPSIIREFGLATNSGYIVFSIEPPGYPEDRFERIKGKLILTNEKVDPWGHGFTGVWVNQSLGADLPVGVSHEQPSVLGDGYIRYQIDT